MSLVFLGWMGSLVSVSGPLKAIPQGLNVPVWYNNRGKHLQALQLSLSIFLSLAVFFMKPCQHKPCEMVITPSGAVASQRTCDLSTCGKLFLRSGTRLWWSRCVCVCEACFLFRVKRQAAAFHPEIM